MNICLTFQETDILKPVDEYMAEIVSLKQTYGPEIINRIKYMVLEHRWDCCCTGCLVYYATENRRSPDRTFPRNGRFGKSLVDRAVIQLQSES